MSSRILISLAVAAALAAPIVAQADSYPGQPKGDWLFRVGMSQLNPDSKNLNASESGLPANLVVDSDVSPTLNIEYMLTDHLGTELLLAWPFTHGIDAKAGGETLFRLGNVDCDAEQRMRGQRRGDGPQPATSRDAMFSCDMRFRSPPMRRQMSHR